MKTSRADLSVRVVKVNRGHQLVKTRGRYWDYTGGDGLRQLGRFDTDSAAADAWRRMLRGEGA